jgi:simple sugar transport system ATP-binding protein/ribose transport system ATP-binding protein
MTTPAPFLRLTDVNKSFEGIRALDNVSVDIARGSVHALVGENGAGKSTLGKIIAGVIASDSGTLELEGSATQFASPREALEHGVTIVAQELALVPTRSVLENVYLGVEPHTGPFVKSRDLATSFSQLVESTGIKVDPSAIVEELSVADQQRVEILRALARKASLIVMDEPTARLATHEALALRGVVTRLRDAGTTIVYVSHFLEEVLEIADDITVLRDGKVVSSSPAKGQTPSTLIERMIGRPLDSTFPTKAPPDSTAPIRLTVDRLSGGRFRDVSLQVREGEIVALTGLVGSGRTELLRAIYGVDRSVAGSVAIDGKPFRRRTPARSIAAGIAMLPESRKLEGLFLGFSISDNVALPSLGWLSNLGFVNLKAQRAAVSTGLHDVDARLRDIGDPVGQLSGGNQQKALFAKSLLGKPRLLLVDEPTRGVDVGAKRQIYELLARLATEGLGILLVSSELEEVIGIAHRVVVMRNGRVAGVLSDTQATERQIANFAFGAAPDPTTKIG